MRRVDDHIIPSLVVCAVEFDKEHVKYIVDRIPNRDELPPPPLALLVGLSASLAKQVALSLGSTPSIKI
jgi:hypothetical protein